MGRQRAFNLIELLIVVLILGIVVAVALPAYLASIRDARLKTANANARAVATAYQTVFLKKRAGSYQAITDAEVLAELERWPDNPCSDSGGKDGYRIESTPTGLTVTPVNDGRCEQPIVVSLGSP